MKFNKNVVFSLLLGLGVFGLSSLQDHYNKEQAREEDREWMKEEIALQISKQNGEES